MAQQRGGFGGGGQGGPGGGRGGPRGGGPGGPGGRGGERGERGGDRRGGGGTRRGRRDDFDQPRSEFEESVVRISRTAAVVKGGKRFSFNALVVAGNRRGKIGVGLGKANEVPSAVDKGKKVAIKEALTVPVTGTTIPHDIIGNFRSSSVLLRPARPGTGIIAGPSVRAVLELLGVRDVVTKSFGSTNPLNLVKATLDGLKHLRTRQEIEKLRGVKLDELGEYADADFAAPESKGDDRKGGRGRGGRDGVSNRGGRGGGAGGGGGGRGRGGNRGGGDTQAAAAPSAPAPAAPVSAAPKSVEGGEAPSAKPADAAGGDAAAGGESKEKAAE